MKLGKIIIAVGLLGVLLVAAASVQAAPANGAASAGAAVQANHLSPQQLLGEARKLYAAHNYEAAYKRLQQVAPDQLGFFDRMGYDSLLGKTQKAIGAKPADEKSFADGRDAYTNKRYATAIAKLSQAASSDYLEPEKAQQARALLQLAEDAHRKAVDEAVSLLAQAKTALKNGKAADARKLLDRAKAMDVRYGFFDRNLVSDVEGQVAAAEKVPVKPPVAVAAKPAETTKTAAAPAETKPAASVAETKPAEKAPAKPAGPTAQQQVAEAQKLYDAGNYDEALKKLKGVSAGQLGLFERWGYNSLVSKTEKAVAGRAAAEKALAQGRTDLTAKKYDVAVPSLSQAASSDYLKKDDAAAARDLLAQARDEQSKAQIAARQEKMAKEAKAKELLAQAQKAPAKAPAKPSEKAPVAVVGKTPAPPVPTAPKPAETGTVAAKVSTPAAAQPSLLVQAKRAEAEDEMKLGADALAHHEYEKARIHYAKALQLWPDSANAKRGYEEASRFVTEREEPLIEITRDVRSLERQRIIADIQSLMATAERAMSRAERPEDYNEALRPLAQADRTIDTATVLQPEEQERLREEVYALRKQAQGKKTTAEGERSKKAVAEATTREDARRRADRLERENKISQLWERATELRRSMQFGEAIQVLDRLLLVDPTDERAMRWREDLLYLEAQSRQVRVRTTREASGVEALVDVEKAATPLGDEVNGVERPLRYPSQKDWSDLTVFRREFTKAVSAKPAAVVETERRLTEPIDLDFERTSLDNVLKYISEVQRGLNIVIDPDIAAGGIDLTTRVVDLKVKRVQVKEVLSLILGADLGYKVQSGYILITTKEKMQQNLPVVTYPVQDLVASIPDFADQAPRFEVSNVMQAASQASGGGGGGFGNIFGAGGAGAAAAAAAEQPGWRELVDIIQRTVTQQSDPSVAAWSDEGGPAAVEYMNGLLIITQTERGHTKVSDLLEQLRRERAIMINVESRFCTVTDEFLQDITLDVDAAFNNGPTAPGDFGKWNGAPIQDPAAPTPPFYNTLPGIPPTATFPVQQGQPIIISQTGSNGLGTQTLLPVGGTVFGSPQWTANVNQGGMLVSGVFLDEIQVGFMLRAIQADVRSTVLQAPRVTLYNGQRSYISVSTVTTYIADVQPVVAEAAVGWDPTIGAIPVGVTLDVKATVSADRRYVQMDLRPQVADIESFEHSQVTAAVPALGIATATIDLPRVRVQDFKTTVSVPDSGTLLLGGTRQYIEGEVETGVPVLSKIPIIKRLFNNRATVRRANNLIILIRPKIIIQAEEEHRLGYDNI